MPLQCAQLPQCNRESANGESEHHDGRTGSHPGEKCPLIGKMISCPIGIGGIAEIRAVGHGCRLPPALFHSFRRPGLPLPRDFPINSAAQALLMLFVADTSRVTGPRAMRRLRTQKPTVTGNSQTRITLERINEISWAAIRRVGWFRSGVPLVASNYGR